jgi:hypothetical protein
MKKTTIILFLILGLFTLSKASTRSDVKIIEASENIRYLSQKIAKEYLYLYYNPKKINLKDKLTRSMRKLKENIHTIAINTQNDESKNILNFLTYTNEEIQLLLTEKANNDKSILILDYSETFVEAANSIQFLHQYKFSDEEKMLMSLKELEYLLERVIKYYMASIMNLNKISNAQHMQRAILKIEVILSMIKNYPYPKKIKKEQKKIVDYWRTNKKFLNILTNISVPNLLLISTKNFKASILRLELYHKQNQ